MTPRATYRLQFSPRFGFRDAAALAPYLQALGVSHVYASPFFAARPGSTHGYDVIDHNRLNPELGDEGDFAAMTDALRRCGLGMIADFVPNHMGVWGAANRFWLSVLEWGPASPYAGWFDIDWAAPTPGLTGKLLAPVLGEAYGDALASGALALRLDAKDGGLAVWAHDTHKLPVRVADYAEVLRRAPGLGALAQAFAGEGAGAGDPRWDELRSGLARAAQAEPAAVEAALAAYRGRAGDLAGWAELDALIARQHWRPAKFNLAADAINYRRFFAISDLAGLRVEDPEVFDPVHALLLDLIERGAIDGVRIDHIDGLRDPRAYALRLRAAASRPFYLLVEKILARDERLPAAWRTDGTTGYEFANLLVGVIANPAGAAALSACYGDFTGRGEEAPEAVVRAAKVEVMTGMLAAEVEALARRLHAAAQADPRTRDLGAHSLRAGLTALIADLDVYRTYADADGMAPRDCERVAAAVARARGHAPALDPAVFDFLAAALTLAPPREPTPGGEGRREAALRMQQLSGPVMAKGLEDTALYRFNRLIALNEVGSEPGSYGVDVPEFHAANAERLAREPHAMLATSTHDTKRGEDARLRIAAISGDVARWRRDVFAWSDLLRRRRRPDIDPEPDLEPDREIDPNEEYFFYQLLLGAWPADLPAETEPPADEFGQLRERVGAAMLKSVREAGRSTRWTFGDAAYEAAVAGFVDRALDPAANGAFLASFRAAAARFGDLAKADGLVQTALKLTVPGVPDIYQGAEFWEQSLVDPDNRRPVDFAARSAALGGPGIGAAGGFTARDKLGLIARLLALRRERPRLFDEGSYEPLALQGTPAVRCCGFLRRHGEDALLVAVAFGWPGAGDVGPSGADVRAALSAGRWANVLDSQAPAPQDPSRLFERLPVCVLVRTP